MVWGDLIAAGGSLLGGLLGAASNKKANEQNAALQREFAQNGIRWKVADAKAAGLHPLAALGVNTLSASPSYVGDTSMANAVSNMGQDIGRAVNSTRTNKERADKFAEMQMRSMELDLQNKELNNQLISSEIARVRDNTPPTPSGTLPNRDLAGQQPEIVEDMVLHPLNRVKSADDPAKEAGHLTEYTYSKTADGGLTPVMSSDFKDRSEDDVIAETFWHVRNGLLSPSNKPDPKEFPLPDGYHWEWDAFKQAFYPEKDSLLQEGYKKGLFNPDLIDY